MILWILIQTHHHGLQLHTVGWNAAAAVLERLLQVLLTRFSDACQNAHIVTSRGLRARQRFHLAGVCACVGVFTLILRSGAEGGLLQVFEQEGFEDLGAAMEGGQDVEEPPASLATITAGHTRSPGITGLGEGVGWLCVCVS